MQLKALCPQSFTGSTVDCPIDAASTQKCSICSVHDCINIRDFRDVSFD